MFRLWFVPFWNSALVVKRHQYVNMSAYFFKKFVSHGDFSFPSKMVKTCTLNQLHSTKNKSVALWCHYSRFTLFFQRNWFRWTKNSVKCSLTEKMITFYPKIPASPIKLHRKRLPPSLRKHLLHNNGEKARKRNNCRKNRAKKKQTNCLVLIFVLLGFVSFHLLVYVSGFIIITIIFFVLPYFVADFPSICHHLRPHTIFMNKFVSDRYPYNDRVCAHVCVCCSPHFFLKVCPLIFFYRIIIIIYILIDYNGVTTLLFFLFLENNFIRLNERKKCFRYELIDCRTHRRRNQGDEERCENPAEDAGTFDTFPEFVFRLVNDVVFVRETCRNLLIRIQIKKIGHA